MEQPLPNITTITTTTKNNKDLEHDGSNSSLGDDDDDLSSTQLDFETESDDGRLDIADNETRWIQWSKVLVVLVLFLGTTLCAYSVYTFTSSQEEEDFKVQFESIGDVIIDVSQITADNVFDTIKSMSTTITSFALATNATWPFVTIPNYVARGTQLLKLSGSFYVTFSPLVPPHQRSEWEKYSVEHQGWMNDDMGGGPPAAVGGPPAGVETGGDSAGGPPAGVDGGSGGPVEGGSGDRRAQEEQGGGGGGPPPGASAGIVPFIWESAVDNAFVPLPVEDRNTSYGPFWQTAPVFPFIVNQDIFSVRDFDKTFDALVKTDDTVLSDQYFDESVQDISDPRSWPVSYITSPVHRSLEKGSEIVALYSAVLPWHKYFTNTVPAGLGGLHVVVRNTCQQYFTYVADGENVTFVGLGDLHDDQFDEIEISDRFASVLTDQAAYNDTDTGTCKYSLSVYPTKEFHARFVTDNPYYYTAAVVFIFALTSLVFVMYDCLVKRKDKKVMTSATNTNAIVNNLFPAAIRDRLMDDAIRRRKQQHGGRGLPGMTTKNGLQEAEDQKAMLLKTKPIADLFPNVTVMFADINGFTAWASSREPSQVFTLLEQIYGSFDILAKARGVFKVETTGDCYVAAAGLPEPRADHAVVMARFARDCLNEMNQNVNKLEILLGPDTAELSMRFGIHSGPVTGGVLRGDKSRFQLFGDTVNMASRIESTGTRNRIHVSQETTNCLIEQGRGAWLKPRVDKVFAKGKGEVQTYWLDFASPVSRASHRTSLSDKGMHQAPRRQNMKAERLIEWNVTVLQGLLKKIVAMRPPSAVEANKRNKNKKKSEEPQLPSTTSDHTVLAEVKEIIELPGKAAAYQQDPESIELDPRVIVELRDYITAIASMYRDNSFHSFEHASHVTQSVTKLLSRVVTPDAIDYAGLSYVKKQKNSQLHEYTYGITSDPLTQFACAFSALIHDVDHTGIPNVALIKEDEDIAKKYNNKSVAEQNSVDLAWALLEGENFTNLRQTIYSNEGELCRFRQLVVNSVMATDIADKELGALRKRRWNKAFNLDDQSVGSLGSMPSATTANTPKEDADRKATIVIEHLIQASDVSHTMQHWHVYLKWNERLFREMYTAFLAGRLENDPSTGWYKGELGFFDFYLIPLGKKLKECGVFGVSSDEYLNYAVANRKEWELKGEEVVARYLASFHESQLEEAILE